MRQRLESLIAYRYPIRRLVARVSQFPTMTVIKRVLREPYQTTIDRLETNKDREDAKTKELEAILLAKTALVESKTTNAQLRKDIRAIGGKPAKSEPEAPPVVKSRRA